MPMTLGTIAGFRRANFGTNVTVVQFHHSNGHTNTEATVSRRRLAAMLGYGPTFLDATAFDRMDFDINPYGEHPDGTPCAYCLANDGEILPQGWNLIGPICRWCLRDWHLMGSGFVYWRRQKAWAIAILRPLTDIERGTMIRRSCELILAGKLVPTLQLKIAEYAVPLHGRDDYSPRRRQATMWINVCRRIQAARAAPRAPPPPPYRQPPQHLNAWDALRRAQINGYEEHMHDNDSSSSFEID